MSTSLDQLIKAHEEIEMLLMNDNLRVSKIQDERDCDEDFITVRSQQSFDAEHQIYKFREAHLEEGCYQLAADLEGISKLHILQQELFKARENLQQLQLNQLTCELLNKNKFDEYRTWCDEAVQHLANLCSNRDLLLYYLQQQPTHSCLTMPHEHHRELECLLKDLCDIITNACSNVTLMKGSHHTGLQPRVENCVAELARLHGALRTALADVRTLQHFRPGTRS